MFKIVKKISILLFAGIFLFSSAEANWITKKSDKSKETIKKEKKLKSEWIKLKKKEIKKNKEDYKKKEKNISKAVKSWITKKTKKDKFLEITSLPKSQIYFTAYAGDGRIFYGYINDDKESEKINFQGGSIYKISKGKGYIQHNKAICNIATERGIIANNIIGFVSGECSDKTKFTGQYSQKSGSGSAETEQKIKINFNFAENLKISKTQLAKLIKKTNDNNHQPNLRTSTGSTSDINLSPTGKYYALLIGNSNYVKWASLKSPKNDVTEIAKILNSKYNFKKVITVIDGTEKQIMKSFKELSKLTSDNDYVLIYYSGHGDNRGVNNYWIPVDGAKESGLGDWINTSEIGNYIKEEIPNRHIVLMSDSCYFDVKTKGNQITGSKKLKSYQKLLNRRAIMLIQSGSNEPVLDSTDGKHSMFAKSFISSIKNNENVVTMSTIIEDIYVSHGDMQQQPIGIRIKGWGDSGGDFLFISKK